jgi:hypothetical protein
MQAFTATVQQRALARLTRRSSKRREPDLVALTANRFLRVVNPLKGFGNDLS